MTAKEYLMGIRLLDARIDTKLERVMRERARAERVTSVLSPVRGSGHSVGDPMRAVDKLIDMERELDGMIDTLVDLKREVELNLAVMNDPVGALVLELRYLHGDSWGKIAARMSYSLRQVHRHHDQALQRFVPPD